MVNPNQIAHDAPITRDTDHAFTRDDRVHDARSIERGIERAHRTTRVEKCGARVDRGEPNSPTLTLARRSDAHRASRASAREVDRSRARVRRTS